MTPLAGAVLQKLRRELAEPIRGVLRLKKSGELAGESVGVLERRLPRAIVDEKVERIDRANIDGELDREIEVGDLLPGLERDPRDVVTVGIALPVQPVLGRDMERIALDRCACVVGWLQADHLRPQERGSRIDIATAMLDEYAHAAF